MCSTWFLERVHLCTNYACSNAITLFTFKTQLERAFWLSNKLLNQSTNLPELGRFKQRSASILSTTLMMWKIEKSQHFFRNNADARHSDRIPRLIFGLSFIFSVSSKFHPLDSLSRETTCCLQEKLIFVILISWLCKIVMFSC